MASLLDNGEQVYLDSLGVPLAGGSVYFYIPNTTTNKAIYADPLSATAINNPVILSPNGRPTTNGTTECGVYGNGQYRQQVYDSLGNLIWDKLTYGFQYSMDEAANSIIGNPTNSVGDAQSILLGTSLSISGSGPYTLNTTSPANGQCKLIYTNTTTLTLLPKNGNGIIINALPYTVPSSGVTLSNSGLSANTVYYVYATIVSGSITLVASATGHVTNASNGVEVESGNAAATLVGMVTMNSSGNFEDDGGFRGVRSWFNEYGISGSAALAVATYSDNITSVTPIFTELTVSSVPVRLTMTLWLHERVQAIYNAEAQNASAGNIHIFMGINQPGGTFTGSSSVPSSAVRSSYNTGTGYVNITQGVTFGVEGAAFNGGGAVNEGDNVLLMYGAVDTGTANYETTRGQTNIGYITVRSAIV